MEISFIIHLIIHLSLPFEQRDPLSWQSSRKNVVSAFTRGTRKRRPQDIPHFFGAGGATQDQYKKREKSLSSVFSTCEGRAARVRCVVSPRSRRRTPVRGLFPPQIVCVRACVRACLFLPVMRNGRGLFWNSRLTSRDRPRKTMGSTAGIL